MAENVILGKCGVIFRHGTVFPPKQGLYQKEARAMESPKMYSSCRCNKRTYLCRSANYPDSCSLLGAISALTYAYPQTTPTHVRQYRAENGMFGKSGATVHPGAVFTPKQRLYQKEARTMESTKKYSSRCCNKQTYLCGSANHPSSYMAVQGRERDMGEIQGYLSPWCSVCTKARVITKGSKRYGEPKNVFLSSVQ